MDVLWKHKKGGLYRIEGFVVIEKGLVPAVAYRSVENDGPTFIRPCAEFFDGRFRSTFDTEEEEG